MYPPPRITRDLGCAGSRMMSSFVWWWTPESAITWGTTGREPAATTTWSAEMIFCCDPWPVRRVRSPTNTACWS